MRTGVLVAFNFIAHLHVSFSNSTSAHQKSAGALQTFVSAAFGTGKTDITYVSHAERVGTEGTKLNKKKKTEQPKLPSQSVVRTNSRRFAIAINPNANIRYHNTSHVETPPEVEVACNEAFDPIAPGKYDPNDASARILVIGHLLSHP